MEPRVLLGRITDEQWAKAPHGVSKRPDLEFFVKENILDISCVCIEEDGRILAFACVSHREFRVATVQVLQSFSKGCGRLLLNHIFDSLRYRLVSLDANAGLVGYYRSFPGLREFKERFDDCGRTIEVHHFYHATVAGRALREMLDEYVRVSRIA